MKIKLFTLSTIFILFTIDMNAQVNQGSMIYNRIKTIKTTQFIGGEKSTISNKTSIESFSLSFVDSIAIWEPLPSISIVEEGSSAEPLSVSVADVKSVVSDNRIFINTEKDVIFTKKELNGQSFLVEDSIPSSTWRLTGETKQILGFNAFKATTIKVSKYYFTYMENGVIKRGVDYDKINVAAWFTSEISFKGWFDISGLPGTVLEIDYNDGETTFKAQEFKEKINTKRIRPMKDGKVVTNEQFIRELEKLQN